MLQPVNIVFEVSYTGLHNQITRVRAQQLRKIPAVSATALAPSRNDHLNA